MKNNLRPSKKSPGLKDYNELHQKHEVYDFNDGRHIQYLTELRDLCVKNTKKAPTMAKVESLIAGTEKVIRTVF